MSADIASLDLTSRRRSLIGYSLGMAAYVLAVVALYPAFKDTSGLDDLTKNSPGVAAAFGISGSITSTTGWVSANIYANFYPLILLLLTIGYGASCLAGQEHDGHLEMVLSLPFTRTRVVVEKVGAMVLQGLLFSVVVFVFVVAGRAFELPLGIGHLATATIAVWLMGVDFGLVALAIGGGTGNRGMALGVASAIAAASFLVSSLAPLVSWLAPARFASLFYWSVGNGQLDHGLSWGGLAVLLATGVILAGAALRLFERHDLS